MEDSEFLETLQTAFGGEVFTVHAILEVVPQVQLPLNVRLAHVGRDLVGTSGTRSLGLYLRKMDGVETIGRSAIGRVWRITPDAKGHQLGQPVGTIVGRVGICRHCLKESGNLGQHEKRCAVRSTPAAPQPNTYLEEVNHDVERA